MTDVRLVVEDVAVGARLLAALPRFLRRPLAPGEAEAVLRRRREQRSETFLALVRTAMERPSSPYPRLLEHAGCSLEELVHLVRRDGIEGGLRNLAARGVYLTVDEFKARRDVVRGSLRFRVDTASLFNPAAVVHGVAESSGSRGPRTAVPIDLAFIRDHAVNHRLALDAWGDRGWTHALWTAPGGTAVAHQLDFACAGKPPARWFTPVDPRSPAIHARYRLGARALRLGGALAGVRLPAAEFVTLEDPAPIARWMADELTRGRTPHLWTFASSAVRVCEAAAADGLELPGARFTAGGEPTTAARLAAIRRVGAEVAPRYGTTETDVLAFGCLAPREPDDQHVFDDRHAVVQPPAGGPLPDRALLVSSVLPTAPLLLLNVSLGDQATLSRRACGCPLERLGWSTHVHGLRSFEKLTAGGITFLDTDVAHVLEHVLPARFGGSPTDYQLVEDGAADGSPSVRLLVHPRVGELDGDRVREAFLDAIGRGTEGERIMALQWRAAGLPRVERAAPLGTPSGKILHLHRT